MSRPGNSGRQSSGVRPLVHAEERVVERTGRPTEDWFGLLDAWGATGRSHAEIARWLVEEHEVDGWWAQSLTVGYEQARGMRAPGQHRDGTFSATVSRTVDVPPERVREAYTDDALRDRWLPPGTLRTRPSTAARSYRADVTDGYRLVAWFDPTGDGRTRTGVSLERLPDPDAAARARAVWRGRLDDLVALLTG